MKTVEQYAEDAIEPILNIFKDENDQVNPMIIAAAVGAALASIFHVLDDGGPIGQECVKLTKDTIDHLFTPATATVVRARFPRSVFPPCSSCGQDHHPSMDCANEAQEG